MITAFIVFLAQEQEGASPVSSSNENEISGAMVFPAR